jgi:hypothetical protein
MNSSARNADWTGPLFLSGFSVAFVIAIGVFLPNALVFAILALPVPLFILFLSWNAEGPEHRRVQHARLAGGGISTRFRTAQKDER